VADGGDPSGTEGPEIKGLNALEANNQKWQYLASMD
jgi:hypothetical protein